MDNQNGETIFVTGKGMKIPVNLIAGSICVGLGIILGAVFSSEGYSVVFYGAFVYGIAYIVMYFRYLKMTIAVSNLRIMGRCVYHSSIDIPLGQVNSVQIKGNGFLWVFYTNNSGKQKKAIFPKMENTEQIYNAIYSLTSAPPSPQGVR